MQLWKQRELILTREKCKRVSGTKFQSLRGISIFTCKLVPAISVLSSCLLRFMDVASSFKLSLSMHHLAGVGVGAGGGTILNLLPYPPTSPFFLSKVILECLYLFTLCPKHYFAFCILRTSEIKSAETFQLKKTGSKSSQEIWGYWQDKGPDSRIAAHQHYLKQLHEP